MALCFHGNGVIEKIFKYNVKYNNKIIPDGVWSLFNYTIVVESDSHSVEELTERAKIY